MLPRPRSLALAIACALWSPLAAAQEAAPPTDAETRPATPTVTGDTGLWFVPTAEVLAHGRWSASAYRRGVNDVQGFTNIADVAGTVAVGVGGRTEVFGSFNAVTRIDRDLRPLFLADAAVGGSIARHPRVIRGWSGNQVGDLTLGAKINLWSALRQKPLSLAVRALVKLPTGDSDSGASTGAADAAFDLVASTETRARIELAGHAGYSLLGQPDGFDAPGGAFRWGVGGQFPSRSPVRATLELTGLVPTDDTVRVTGSPVVGVDGSVAPPASDVSPLTRALAGVTWQHRSGFFLGGGLAWNFPRRDRAGFDTDDNDAFGDFADWQVRLGYHPGTRIYVPPPPPLPPPLPPAPPQNRPPVVQARCEPCTIEAGRTSTVTADASDPDGDALTYRWSAPAGTFQGPADRQTVWTAPRQEGPVQATVSVSDGRGGTASAQVTLQVLAPPPVVELNFEDVFFDFDRSTLRPDALRLLDDAVAKLQANPGRAIVIEGHTCNIGTAEYNLALGDRRASSVRDYLLSRGVPASRLETRSYGEERPKYDNAREETRRLNRRAALVVRVQ